MASNQNTNVIKVKTQIFDFKFSKIKALNVRIWFQIKRYKKPFWLFLLPNTCQSSNAILEPFDFCVFFHKVWASRECLDLWMKRYKAYLEAASTLCIIFFPVSPGFFFFFFFSELRNSMYILQHAYKDRATNFFAQSIRLFSRPVF